MHKPLITLTATLGFIAVLLGAFGAHGLRPLLSSDQYQAFQMASRYHFIHVLATLFVGLAYKPKDKLLAYAGYAFVVGIICFSGSIYLLELKDVLGLNGWAHILGPITPLGGLFFMIGWLLIAIWGIKIR